MARPDVYEVFRDHRPIPPSGTRLYAVGSADEARSEFVGSLDWLTSLTWQFETTELFPLDPWDAPTAIERHVGKLTDVAGSLSADGSIFGSRSRRISEVAYWLQAVSGRFMEFERWGITTILEQEIDMAGPEDRQSRASLLGRFSELRRTRRIPAYEQEVVARMLRNEIERIRDRFWMVSPRGWPPDQEAIARIVPR